MSISRYDCLHLAINFGRSVDVRNLIDDTETIYKYLNQIGETKSIRDFYHSIEELQFLPFQEKTLMAIDDNYKYNYLATGRQVGATTIAIVFALHRAINLGETVWIVARNYTSAIEYIQRISNMKLDTTIKESNKTYIKFDKGSIKVVSSPECAISPDVIIFSDITTISYSVIDSFNPLMGHAKKVLGFGTFSKDSNNIINRQLVCESSDTYFEKLPSSLRVGEYNMQKQRDTISEDEYRREWSLDM